MYNKAQSAIEFIILIGAVLFFFVSFLVAIQIQNLDKTNEQRNTYLKEIAGIVKDEINLADTSSNGYRRNFTIPSSILGEEYNIVLANNTIYAYTLNGKHALAIPTTRVIGNIMIGSNIIRRQNETVYLNS